MALAEPGRPDGMPAGRNGRARELCALLEDAGLDQRWLLRSLQDPSGMVPAQDADVPEMAHNALKAWAPSGYGGHPGYQPGHFPARRELLFCLMLEGDIRAEHLGYWRDDNAGLEWNPALGEACAGWHRLPAGPGGRLIPAGLGAAVHEAVHAAPQRGLFVDRLRAAPVSALAEAYGGRARLAGSAGQAAKALTGAGLSSGDAAQLARAAAESPAGAGRLLAAAQISQAAGLSGSEAADVARAALLAGPRGSGLEAAVQAARDAGWEGAAGILEEIAGGGRPEGLAALAADCRRAYLASDDLWAAGLAEEAAARGLDDSAGTLDEFKAACLAGGWASREGAGLWKAACGRRESRIRMITSGIRGRREGRGTRKPRS